MRTPADRNRPREVFAVVDAHGEPVFAHGRIEWADEGKCFRVVTLEGASDWADYWPECRDSAWRLTWTPDPRSALERLYLFNPAAMLALRARVACLLE